MRVPFLTANWTNLIVANYEVNPELLLPYLPEGIELDDFDGKYFVSLVAFNFEKNKLFGVIPSIPFSFEEINLRFYVKKIVDGELRRGVTFIQEIVPSKLIAWLARTLYNEPYVKHGMHTNDHLWHVEDGGIIEYGVRHTTGQVIVHAHARGKLEKLEEKSFPHFILEHYWGYTPQRNGQTMEYEVLHPAWRYRSCDEFSISGSIEFFFAKPFHSVLRAKPSSVFVAEGSKISVFAGTKSRQR